MYIYIYICRFSHFTKYFEFWTIGNCRGDFSKNPDFREQFKFSNFRADFPLWRSKSLYFELIFRYLTVFWVSELIFGVSELIFLVSELIPLYFGCLNLYFVCLNVYFGCLNLYRLCLVSELILWASEDHHSGITRESGNTEGPSILVIT